MSSLLLHLQQQQDSREQLLASLLAMLLLLQPLAVHEQVLPVRLLAKMAMVHFRQGRTYAFYASTS
jgi:hypothetical protein